jgi:hypothetical protein
VDSIIRPSSLSDWRVFEGGHPTFDIVKGGADDELLERFGRVDSQLLEHDFERFPGNVV